MSIGTDVDSAIVKAKAELEALKIKIKEAQTWVQNLADSVEAVFKEHKLEMLVAVGVGVFVGAILL